MTDLQHKYTILTEKLQDCQKALDEYLTEHEKAVETKVIPVKFYSRVNLGLITENYSSLVKSILDFKQGFDAILKKENVSGE